MRLLRSKAATVLAPLALTLLLGGSAYAFMASNAVNQSSAGAGIGQITGYSVSNIHYTLSGQAGDPDNLTSVTFTLTPAPGGQPADAVAVWFDHNRTNVASSALGSCSDPGGPPGGGGPGGPGATTWQCNIGWSQQAGPAPVSTALSIAASH
ncbi:MAG: hypothetical protein M0Z54_05840 [Thermaerobacter sp.]|nr:hypothetical protein [Thermaerobacter sp.]